MGLIKQMNKEAHEKAKAEEKKKNNARLKELVNKKKIMADLLQKQNFKEEKDENKIIGQKLNIKIMEKIEPILPVKKEKDFIESRAVGRPKKTEEEKEKTLKLNYRLKGGYGDFFKDLKGKNSTEKNQFLIDEYIVQNNVLFEQIQKFKKLLSVAWTNFLKMETTHDLYFLELKEGLLEDDSSTEKGLARIKYNKCCHELKVYLQFYCFDNDFLKIHFSSDELTLMENMLESYRIREEVMQYKIKFSSH